MRRALRTPPAVFAITALALLVLALPALLPRASGAGPATRITATAVVDSARGPIGMAGVSATSRPTRVTFECKPRGTGRTQTLGEGRADAVAATIAGADAPDPGDCAVKAGSARARVPTLAKGDLAAGARLVAVLGPVRRLANGDVEMNVAISRSGAITVATVGGVRVLKTGRRTAGRHRLRLKGVAPATRLIVRASGRHDEVRVGGGALAAPTPTPPAAVPTPTATPAATPTPAPSGLTLGCGTPAGRSVTFTGRLTPAGAATIQLVYNLPGAPAGTPAYAYPDAYGDYSQTVMFPAPGVWTVQAQFGGDATRGPSNSASCQVQVS